MNYLSIALEDNLQFDTIRKVLVNMLMYTDCFDMIKQHVRIYSNRIEFKNAGAFPPSHKELLRKDVSILLREEVET
jgi:predicted HTH transcriptional regulator